LTVLIKVLAESIEKEVVNMSNRKKSRPKEPAAKEASVQTTNAGNPAEEAKAGKAGVPRKRKKPVQESKKARGADENAILQGNDVDKAVATETIDEAGTGSVSEEIRKIASPATLADKPPVAKRATSAVTGNIFEMRAEDIMHNCLTWVGPNESLQHALARIQQTDAGYLMVGTDGVLEGIVSKSDLSRAMSPYLQPILAKWRRPLDDATLKIRIKWIMSRPVRTIKRETPLVTIMEYMNQFRGRCLVVTDEEGNVRGLVTAFGIFRAILNHKPGTFAEDRETRALTESAVPVAAT
jgi:CBS domain-containing protein